MATAPQIERKRDASILAFPQQRMMYVTPKFTRGEVDAAGRRLAEGRLQEDDPIVTDLVKINNWRSSHSFPLNSIHVTLRARAQKLDPRALTAQRIKRLSSIEAKLKRFPDMQLSRMHDIGGCRAVVRSVPVVRLLVAAYKRGVRKNPGRLEIAREYDYISNPKSDGYRCVHLVCRYHSKAKQHLPYNGLRIEIQMRSQMQHIWATAVETVGTFIGHALKSSQGPDEWRRFFALMSTYIAMKERHPIVPDTPSDAKELRAELIKYTQELEVVKHLDLYAAEVDAPQEVGATKDQHYFLLELDPSQRQILVRGYTIEQLAEASRDYLAVEREILAGNKYKDAVLVSVKSFAALRRAYPNYFLDTHRFISLVNDAVGTTTPIRSATSGAS